MTVLTASPVYLNGLLLSGRDDATGLEIVVEDIQGWGSPSSNVQFYKRPRQHGSWSGEAWLNPRTIVLSGYIAAPSGGVLRDGKDMLNAACGLDETLLSISEAGFPRTCMARRSDEILYHDTSDTAADFSLQMVADDPRKLGAQLNPNTGLAISTGGLTFPITFPIEFDSTTVTGLITVTNNGNIDGSVVLRLDGPVTDPVINQTVGSQVITFAMTYGLAAGNWLTIDMENETVLENDQSSRAGYVTTRGFMSLLPGDNIFTFTSSVYNASAMLTVITNSSWM